MKCYAAILLLTTSIAGGAQQYQRSSAVPPSVPREFRGVWVATVANTDWPSKAGLSTATQKSELISILDRAAALNLNAVVLQVRPACDAFYPSPIEPWSEYLTGTMGKAPEPYYDPLAFAIEEAHKRGLELHAWFNPYRALHFTSKSVIASKHVSRSNPGLVRRYGKYLWLDPGERDVQEYSLSVVMDVVRRYDIDGVHFDDYFYPYPENAGGRPVPFPDDESWADFGARSGLSRDDWRRRNVDTFVERTYRSVKAAKPWVKFGISPFGIWRPGHPPGVRGTDAYAALYADARKWMMNGWLDYSAPQLYWKIDAREQSFPALLDWWADQNTRGRHLLIGLTSAYAWMHQWNPAEIQNQLQLIRAEPRAHGYIFYNATMLFTNTALTTALERNFNSTRALTPALSWAGRGIPPQPQILLTHERNGGLRLNARASTNSSVRLWLVQSMSNGIWNSEILPGRNSVAKSFPAGAAPETIAVSVIDRFGNASIPSTYSLKPSASAATAPSNVKKSVRRLESPKNR